MGAAMNTSNNPTPSNEPGTLSDTTVNAGEPHVDTGRFWSRALTLAGLVVLGITPWANAALPQPDLPAVCPPLTAFAHPTLFDVFWGTTPIKFPY